MAKAMNTGRLRLYLNNSTELADGKAVIADSEMLTDLLDGASFPRRKQPTLTYTHRATGQGPTPGDYEQIEIEDPLYPDDDLGYIARSATSAFRQARQGMHREKAIYSRMNTHLKYIAAIGGTAVLLFGLVIAMVTHEPEGPAGSGEQPAATAPAPTIPPVLAPRGREDVSD